MHPVPASSRKGNWYSHQAMQQFLFSFLPLKKYSRRSPNYNFQELKVFSFVVSILYRLLIHIFGLVPLSGVCFKKVFQRSRVSFLESIFSKVFKYSEQSEARKLPK